MGKSGNGLVWAKSQLIDDTVQPITLSEHTKHLLKALEAMIDRVQEPIRDALRIAVICHDWGKVLPAFQIKTLRHRDYLPNSPLSSMPHSLFSVLCVSSEELQRRLANRDHVRFVLSAVAYHHWREDFLQHVVETPLETISLLSEVGRSLQDLLQNLRDQVQHIDEEALQLVSFNEEMARGIINGVPFWKYVTPPYHLYFLPERLPIGEKSLLDWILIAGFLQRIDHFASFCEEQGDLSLLEGADLKPLGMDVVRERIRERIEGKNKANSFRRLWQLDAVSDVKNSSVILVAPTGYGKTEFAFLWGSEDKLLYTLPLRAAANQIFLRAQNIFQPDEVGLLHSDADVFLTGDGGEAQSSIKSYELAKHLACPVIISTGDQFFPYALRPPGYEKIYATFSYSRLVIDEIQAYDPRAAAIVVKFAEDVTRMGGKFLLMTATLPKFIRKEIKKDTHGAAVKSVHLYYAHRKQLRKVQRHRVRLTEILNSDGQLSLPAKEIQEILKAAASGKRVLVVANTVKMAQDIYRRILEQINTNLQYSHMQEKAWLIHSRFTQNDRQSLEQRIHSEFSNPKPDSEAEAKILVATQIVEASLDIDADVLYTEIAPMDALVQRMGRVWRRYSLSETSVVSPKEDNVIIWCFRKGFHSGRERVYDSQVVEQTKQIITERMSRSSEQFRVALLSEIDKYLMVCKLYDQIASKCLQRQKLEEGGETSKSSQQQKPREKRENRYIQRFYQTKEILDAGYLSERLEEARELFREIANIPVIPSSRREEFLQAVGQFFECRGDAASYTLFKREILSEFVVDVPHPQKKSQLESLLKWLPTLKGHLSERNLQRVSRWCQGIYFVNCKYDPRCGILLDNPVADVLLI